MDPVTAVGVAANILQFVDYICHVLEIGKQIRRTGMGDWHQDIETSAALLKHQAQRLQLRKDDEGAVVESDQVRFYTCTGAEYR